MQPWHSPPKAIQASTDTCSRIGLVTRNRPAWAAAHGGTPALAAGQGRRGSLTGAGGKWIGFRCSGGPPLFPPSCLARPSSSTCSAASAAKALGCTGPGCGRWRSARPIPSRAASCAGTGPAFPSMTTYAPCPPPGCGRAGCRGRGSSAAASPARTAASRAGAREWQGRARACGPTWLAWSPSCDRAGWWLRTSLASEAAGRTECCVTWRLRATPAGRSWWVLSMPAPRTGGRACGWWRKALLPTPVARDWKWGSASQRGRRRACQLSDAVGGRLNPGYAEWMMGFPPGWTG